MKPTLVVDGNRYTYTLPNGQSISCRGVDHPDQIVEILDIIGKVGFNDQELFLLKELIDMSRSEFNS